MLLMMKLSLVSTLVAHH